MFSQCPAYLRAYVNVCIMCIHECLFKYALVIGRCIASRRVQSRIIMHSFFFFFRGKFIL